MPPDYVLQFLPLEFVGVVMAIAAAAWGARVILDVNKRLRAWAEPWIAWIHRFRESWDGTPEVRDSGGSIVHHATPGVPARLDGYDEKFVGFTNALTEHAEAIADVRYNVKANSGHSAHDDLTKKLDANTAMLQELLSTVTEIVLRQSTQGNDMQDIRNAFTAALRHNHPDYEAPLARDAVTLPARTSTEPTQEEPL